MAAPMQHMAGPGQMMQQQARGGRPSQAQLQTVVYQNMLNHVLPFNGGWQKTVTIQDRMGKVLGLCVLPVQRLRFRAYAGESSC
jgi:hypothetical protein